MSKLIWIALFGLTLAGCAADSRNSSSAGGSTATTAPAGSNEDMRNSTESGPGPEGDKQRPAGSTPRSTY
jgi:hypothetical protein